MKQITFNPNNEPYYSEDFIKGFKCGAERQFEADKADRPQGEWIETEERETYIGADWDADPVVPRKYRLPLCSICGEEFGIAAFDYNFCPNCGARMKGADNE